MCVRRAQPATGISYLGGGGGIDFVDWKTIGKYVLTVSRDMQKDNNKHNLLSMSIKTTD